MPQNKMPFELDFPESEDVNEWVDIEHFVNQLNTEENSCVSDRMCSYNFSINRNILESNTQKPQTNIGGDITRQMN